MARTPSDYAINVVRCKLWGLVNPESPVEHILGVEIFRELANLRPDMWCWVHSKWEFEKFVTHHSAVTSAFALVPDFTVPGVGRVDYAIFIPELSTQKPLLVIEVDGHNFHNTREQESEDRRRERVLRCLDIPSLRFTGEDVVKSSSKYAQEIAEFVDMKLREIEAQHVEASYYETLVHHPDSGLLAQISELESELMYRRAGVL
jgi:hypothetical protein